MEKNLHSLIRLKGWKVDEKRRQLGQLLRVVESLEGRLNQLYEEVAREQTVASEAPEEGGVIYGNFAESIINERKNIIESLKKAEAEVEVAREELKLSFHDHKKYEMAQEDRDKKEQAEKKRQEQIYFDDISAEVYRQKSKNRF